MRGVIDFGVGGGTGKKDVSCFGTRGYKNFSDFLRFLRLIKSAQKRHFFCKKLQKMVKNWQKLHEIGWKLAKICAFFGGFGLAHRLRGEGCCKGQKHG